MGMFDPIKEFENNKNKYNYPLNFKYVWINKKEKSGNFDNLLSKYKNKLGWYVELYEKKGKHLYENIYEPYNYLNKFIAKEYNNINNRISLSIENKFINYGNNFILKKGINIYKG